MGEYEQIRAGEINEIQFLKNQVKNLKSRIKELESEELDYCDVHEKSDFKKSGLCPCCLVVPIKWFKNALIEIVDNGHIDKFCKCDGCVAKEIAEKVLEEYESCLKNE